MSQRITIDPVTRIEGHLRIDVEVEGGKVKNAWSSAQMWRGIELILKGRDPREAWLFTQRICGVCTTVHAIASVRAVENALQMEVPLNAQLIRNLVITAHSLHDHVVHFYHLSALDWVDVTSALKADPAKASALGETISAWTGNSTRQLQAVKDKLTGFVGSGQLGIFTNGYWGHPAMRLPPEVNLLAVNHYLQALDFQRKANQVVAILGGKTPNIQNLAVGGVTNPINLDNAAALNMDKLFMVRDLLKEVKTFIEQVYIPDVCAIASMYPDWLGYGAGVQNYLAVPDMPTDTKGTQFAMPGGTIMGGDYKTLKPITSFNDTYFRDNVAESVAHAWYQGDWQKHPFQEGPPEPSYTDFQDDGKYSWSKAPRFMDKPMQVGPTAAVLTAYLQNHEPTVRWANFVLETAGSLAKTKLGPQVLESTLGRHAARAIRCAVMAEIALNQWDMLVANIAKGDTQIFNEPKFPGGEVKGFGFHEAPRGTLSHWVIVRDGKIADYQAVVPSTWNAGPRDGAGNLGPYEASLVGNPMADPERPLEALRTIHSFDPCLACAVHTVDPEGNEIAQVKVL